MVEIHTDGRPMRWIGEEDVVEIEAAREAKQRRLRDANPIKSFAAGPLLGDIAAIPPRQWLLGTVFCRQFVSSLIGSGGGGKTAIRYAQYLAVATGRPITGEHVHKRSRVLLLCYEDDLDEMRRRLGALMLHHRITAEEIGDWLHLAVMPSELTLLHTDRGVRSQGVLLQALQAKIDEIQPDLIGIDPWARMHGLEDENNNAGMAHAMGCLTRLASERNIAIDLCHHAHKGHAEAGDAGRSRGASANIDAQRLARTLTPMTGDEAAEFGIPEDQRRRYVRIDDAKVNLAPATDAAWFRLVGVKLGNGTVDYPNGDEVQTVERWFPPDPWKQFTDHTINQILDVISTGLPDGRKYAAGINSGIDRQAWRIFQQFAPDLTEKHAKTVLKKWEQNGMVETVIYKDPTNRKEQKGLVVRRWVG